MTAGALVAFGAALVLAATGDSRVSVWFVTLALLGWALVWFEGGPDSAKEIALVATLAAPQRRGEFSSPRSPACSR